MPKKYMLLSLLLSANLFAASTTTTTKSTTTQPSTTFTETTASPRIPAVTCMEKNGLFGYASFLYWQSGFNAATVTTDVTGPANGVALNYQDHSLKFAFNPGFKLGIGANLQHDGWSPIVLWTYMHSSPSQSWTSADHSLLNDLNLDSSVPASIFGANEVNTKWHLNFNAIDLEIGKDLPLSPFYMSRMFGSLKLASVNNQLIVNYNGLVNTTTGLPSANQAYTSKNQSWLVGPRVGTNVYFGIVKDFSFMATVATYVFACMAEPKVTTYAGAGKRQTSSQTSIAPGFDLYLGFNYGHCFAKKAYVNFSAGYEFQYYGAAISQFQSLSFNGLNATVLVNF